VAITLAEPRQRRLLQNIERLTKQEIDVQKIPTVGDLRERQVQVTVDAVREAMMAHDLDDYEPVLFELVADGSEREIALAAIKLFHQARGATTDEVEIPDASERKPRDRDRGPKGAKGAKSGKGQPRGNVGPGTGLVYVGVGRRGHIRPGDLVGCIANETELTGRDIGPIRISEHYSVVGVPEAAVDSTIQAINGTTIRGKRAKARRFVEKQS
jgi:ATP-dependent RNA helicase DeaD